MKARLWACNGGLMCVAIAVNLPPLFLTTFRETFGGTLGLTAEQVGRIPAVVFAGLTLGIIVSGPLVDRWGAKLFAVLGLAMTSAGLVFMGLSGSYGVLLASAGMMGFGAGVLDMVLSPIVAALEPHRRTAAMNWLHSFYCTGAVLTTLVGSVALRLHVPWRAVFPSAAVFPVVILAVFVRMRVPPLIADGHRRLPVTRLLRSGFFLAALVGIFLGGAAEAAMTQWLPAYAETSLGVTRSSAGLSLTGFLVGMVIGRIVAAMLAERIGPIRLMTASCVLTASLFAVACFCPHASAALAACMAVGLTVGSLWPTMVGVTATRFPTGGAAMFALLAAFGNAGCFVMPWVVGIVAGASALNVGLATAGVCPVLMIAALVWMHRRGGPSDETAAA